jgi:transcriptional regulator with XRE-family HTH domain
MEQQRKNRPLPCSEWDTVSRVGQRDLASSPLNLEALRLIRESFAVSGMTQEELGRACGIPRSTLANILSPTAAPRLIHVGQMLKIAVAIGADARTWIGELESFERRLSAGRGDDLARRRTDARAAPQVQKRAARSRPRTPKAGKD